MLYKEYIRVKYISIHKVGNKLNAEGVSISNSNLNIEEKLERTLSDYFLSPFKANEYFKFYHNIDISMNEVLFV